MPSSRSPASHPAATRQEQPCPRSSHAEGAPDNSKPTIRRTLCYPMHNLTESRPLSIPSLNTSLPIMLYPQLPLYPILLASTPSLPHSPCPRQPNSTLRHATPCTTTPKKPIPRTKTFITTHSQNLTPAPLSTHMPLYSSSRCLRANHSPRTPSPNPQTHRHPEHKPQNPRLETITHRYSTASSD